MFGDERGRGPLDVNDTPIQPSVGLPDRPHPSCIMGLAREVLRGNPVRSLVREIIETAILAFLIFLALQFSVQNFRVEGSSMEPTLEDDQYVLVNKAVYFSLDPSDLRALLPFLDVDRDEDVFPFHAPRRGEIIVFQYPLDPSRDFVKRVIGVSGEVVEVREGDVYVNGEKLDEPYVVHRDVKSMDPFRVPTDSYFVLGDNRRSSNDSRDWGAVPGDLVLGRGWFSYWPLDRFEPLNIFGWP